ncbi:unnamed protein product [Kuraishia capsulata CBS 1993]|uniref:DNA ligase n=1 Tax=Kuraishia capsulata CBS 1993 TaxID=1382522 RepID=W6MHP6_9ASCO|nr:uncharacterized protein KUCA_T00001476001 [Kuraishia capsulata CBS 1993]CDK25506.1 unnamed protein product [Kuraishia capsulata CBS 1993]
MLVRSLVRKALIPHSLPIMSKQQTLGSFFSSARASASAPVAKKQKIEITTPELTPDPKTDSESEKDKEVVSESPNKPIFAVDDAKQLLSKETKESTHVPPISNSKPIPYSALADVFEKLEQESARLKNLAIASEFFQEILQSDRPEGLIQVTYLMINRLGPDYEPGLELGLGETLLLKAIAEGTGRAASQIKADYHRVGDIGLVAQQSRSRQPTMFKPKPLTVPVVFENLTQIARMTGNSSQARKIGIINKMLTACENQEAKFLMRSLEGKLRINFGEKSVLVALAKAFVENEASKRNKKGTAEALVQAEEKIKVAFSQTPNYEVIIKTALEYGIQNIVEHCTLKPGIPLKPMLAKPTKSITEILDQFQGEEFTCEYKYDGERAQLHLLEDGSIRIYSRNSEDMSERYPDLIAVVKAMKASNPNVNTLILDCECVAWDVEQKKILPFQVLSTRKRKDVQTSDIKVQVCLFAFDCLFYNGESLITQSLKERRSLLKDNLEPIEGKFQYAKGMDSSNVDEIQGFLDQSVKDACEGLMVKTLNGSESGYEPSKRSRNWLKLKKDYLEGVGDSLDLVVVGGYIGKGKRTGWYGGFLLATYNQDTGEYETACKIGTGFSEDDLKKLSETLKPTELSKPKGSFVYEKNNSNALPDVWFEPTLVFEVLTADLSLSPIYKAGAANYGKGISLRFPRFIRIRDDKGPEDATSSDQIIEFYERQANV